MKSKIGLLIFLAFAALTIGYMVWMGKEVRPLTSHEIVAFEFSGNTKQAVEQLTGLGNEKVALMKKSLYLDFGFLILYSISIALGCIVLPRYTGKENWIRIGRSFAFAAGLAGGCDAIENILLFRILAGGLISFQPGLAAVCAGLKFFGVFMSLLFILTTLGALPWMKNKRPGDTNLVAKSDP